MAEKLPWGRYEHESGAWIQFAKAQYRYREMREYRNFITDAQVFEFIVPRIQAWSIVTADGTPVDLDSVKAAIEALKAQRDAHPDKPTTVDILEAFDDVEVTIVSWIVTTSNAFVYGGMLVAPKA